MKDDYVPLKQDEGESLESETIRQQSTASKTIVPWLPAISTLLLSLVLFVFFGMPSTLHIYLAYLMIYCLAGITSLIGRIAFDQQKLPFTPAMSVAFVLVIFPLLVPSSLPIPSSTLPSTLPSILYTNNTITAPSPPSPSHNNVLFVAANLYNSEAILPRFSASLFELAQAVGKDNIFISIYESNSDDRTKALLSDFDNELDRQAIPHHIEMASTSNHIGLHGGHERIKFLANLRNKVYDALEVEPGASFKPRVNRVLWLNDVLFDSKAALALLDTNEGKFDVACGLDYVPLGIYDTWVMRDANMQRMKPLWPHFEDETDVERLRNGQPIRVKSCWNGIAAFNADLLLDGRPAPFSSNKSTLPKEISWPLRFRKSGECLTSECLLINYDLHQLLAHDRQPEIYINPTVQVAYDKATFFLYVRMMHWRIIKPWHLIWEDWIANGVFWFVTDIGRKEAACAKVLDAGFRAYQ